MKGLFKRNDVWWYRFTPAPGCAQVRESLGTMDEIEAIEKAREMKDQASREMREVLDASQTEIDAYLSAKKRDGLSLQTLSVRKYVLQAFIKEVKAASPRLVTRNAVATWFEAARKKNAHTACDYLQTVQLWFKWIVGRGKLASSPAAGIKTPKLKKRHRRVFLMPTDALKLIEAATPNPGLKFAVYCALHAGLRKNEIIEATPAWFDLDAGLLHIQGTATFTAKDNDHRTIPLTTEFRDWIRTEYKLQSPFMLEPKVKHGKHRYRFDFKKAYIGLIKRCGLEGTTFHDLRRTFASLHVSAGTSIYKVAKWLGDDVAVVEESYGHLIPQDDQINAVWAAKAAKAVDGEAVAEETVEKKG